MIRSLAACAASLLAAPPAAAASYSASLEAPLVRSFIAPDISWTCSASLCRGATAESRPIVLCESLAKHAGRVATFLVDGRPLTSAELARCNAAIRTRPAAALAAQ